MEQRTKEWLEWRLNGIGSSDAPVIMGVSPWSTPYKLWLEKTRQAEPKAATKAMQHGNETEPIARQWYEQQMGIAMPQATVEHKKFNFIRASLDGVNGKKGIEIKCPLSPADHLAALAGQVPEKYLWQLRHQMLAADLDSVDYVSFFGQKGTIVTLHREENPERELLGAELEFWELVQEKIAPFTTPELEALCSKFKDNYAILKKLTAEQDEIKKSIISQSNGNKIVCAGVYVTHFMQSPAPKYKEILEGMGVDLSQYKQPKKPAVRVGLEKPKKGDANE